MSKALITSAEGEFLKLQRMALPGLRKYAMVHNYSLVTPSMKHLRQSIALPGDGDPQRPASWYKLAAMYMALAIYDEVLWLDADVMINSLHADPAWNIPRLCWGAMVMHSTHCGWVPNCGVWFLRRKARPLLERLWGMVDYVQGGWWEQAALIDCLGMGNVPLAARSQPNELYRGIHWLNPKFNVVPTHSNWPIQYPVFLHASGMPMEQRLAYFEQWHRGVL